MEIIFHSYEILVYSQFFPLKTELNQLKTWDPPLAADSAFQQVLVQYLPMADCSRWPLEAPSSPISLWFWQG